MADAYYITLKVFRVWQLYTTDDIICLINLWMKMTGVIWKWPDNTLKGLQISGRCTLLQVFHLYNRCYKIDLTTSKRKVKQEKWWLWLIYENSEAKNSIPLKKISNYLYHYYMIKAPLLTPDNSLQLAVVRRCVVQDWTCSLNSPHQ